MCCALKPRRQFLLRTFLTEIVKKRPPLVITMFILKNRSRLLALKANTIPEIDISGITGEAPNESPPLRVGSRIAPLRELEQKKHNWSCQIQKPERPLSHVLSIPFLVF
jgi:hypothetical protein